MSTKKEKKRKVGSAYAEFDLSTMVDSGGGFFVQPASSIAATVAQVVRRQRFQEPTVHGDRVFVPDARTPFIIIVSFFF